MLIRQWTFHGFQLQHIPNISLLQSHHSLIQSSFYENEVILSLLYCNPSQSKWLQKTGLSGFLLHLPLQYHLLSFPFTLCIEPTLVKFLPTLKNLIKTYNMPISLNVVLFDCDIFLPNFNDYSSITILTSIIIPNWIIPAHLSDLPWHSIASGKS